MIDHLQKICLLRVFGGWVEVFTKHDLLDRSHLALSKMELDFLEAGTLISIVGFDNIVLGPTAILYCLGGIK
jgi:hypothetical protein